MTGTTTSPSAPTTLQAVAGFALLFTVSFDRRVRPIEAGAAAQAAALKPFSADELAAYQALRDETELHVLGSAFIEAGRLTHLPIGRIALEPLTGDPQAPTAADVHLFTHVSGAALWEVWLPGQPQDFDAQRWVAWLDEQAESSLPSRVWRALQPLNKAIGGSDAYRQYLPCSVVRLLDQALAALTERHAADIVGLLWRDRSTRTLKPEVIDAELERDYCAREGGITLLGRRAALDIHGNEDNAAPEALASGLPPRSAVPYLITLELLLVERAVLLQLYERLSLSTPASIEGLLELKQQVSDGLEEYYGATLAVTRFGDAVAEDGERLFGIVELYDALMDRLETVSFALTTRYQQRMTQMQFWLTVVFGSTEIGFIAASIATWYYRSELGSVLAWTVGATLVSAGVLVALLRRRIEKP
ncbi:MAG TPA: hypothetical protein DCP03_18805 [Polaromonas sp.]|uniref:hypothetical protein n=1 Tax=Polaromonas sp. UBA4122 TaxID=1947074 RepID=UPI000EC71B3B|nr:hypothetical protein [Polaromonas sp. UBA4122]HAL40037.1 hypothetical protein [Polaromonas sp.]